MLLVTPFAAQATRQSPNTVLIKIHGTWQLRDEHVGGWSVVVADVQRVKSQVIRIGQLIPPEELERYQSTAGPYWGDYCLWYFAELNGRRMFRARTAYKTDILIDLELAEAVPSDTYAPQLAGLDKQEIASILENAPKNLSSPDPKLSDLHKIYAALVHCSSYALTNCVPFLRRIEAAGQLSSGAIPSRSDPYTRQAPIDQKKGYWYFENYEVRRLASLALRRLGETPRGFSALEFLPQDLTNAVDGKARRAELSQLRTGQTPRETYELLGPPDYIEQAHPEEGGRIMPYFGRWCGAWRFDIDGPVPFTLLILWSPGGSLQTVEKITPALWNGDALIPDEAVNPLLRPDGSIRRAAQLYGSAFRGKIETIVPPQSTAGPQSSLEQR